MHGMKNRDHRIKLIENMSMSYYFWIGANDIASERNWMWVNGERATYSALNWKTGQGVLRDIYSNCVFVNGFRKSSSIGKAYDEPCGDLYKGLCEKEI